MMVPGIGVAIHGNLLHALLLAFWVLYYDVVFATTELAGYLVLMGGAWETWVDVQTLVIRFDAEDELADTVYHIHAAVPVSQEFFPSPGLAASLPATIWQFT